MSQKTLAELTGYNFRTISQYVNSEDALPNDFVKKAAAALAVTEERIRESPAEFLKEESGPAWRTESVPVALMPDFIVEQLEKHLAGKLPGLNGKDRAAALESLNALGYERDRRVIEKQKPKIKNP